MKSKFCVAALAAATVAVGAFAPAASAATVCHTVKPADYLTVCAGADAGIDGTTVSPSAGVGCSSHTIRCSSDPVVVGKTGVDVNEGYQAPEYDLATVGVRSDDQTVGTVYAGGTGVDVAHENFCTGSDQFCAFGG